MGKKSKHKPEAGFRVNSIHGNQRVTRLKRLKEDSKTEDMGQKIRSLPFGSHEANAE